jgi:hypothetical protein
MPMKPCPPARLYDLAQRLRQNALETSYPAYIRLMTRAAEDLESRAGELESGPEMGGGWHRPAYR